MEERFGAEGEAQQDGEAGGSESSQVREADSKRRRVDGQPEAAVAPESQMNEQGGARFGATGC